MTKPAKKKSTKKKTVTKAKAKASSKVNVSVVVGGARRGGASRGGGGGARAAPIILQSGPVIPAAPTLNVSQTPTARPLPSAEEVLKAIPVAAAVKKRAPRKTVDEHLAAEGERTLKAAATYGSRLQREELKTAAAAKMAELRSMNATRGRKKVVPMPDDLPHAAPAPARAAAAAAAAPAHMTRAVAKRSRQTTMPEFRTPARAAPPPPAVASPPGDVSMGLVVPRRRRPIPSFATLEGDAPSPGSLGDL